VAGSFYPADPESLREAVERLFAEAPPPSGEPPRALVAPHAGYVYSGPVAASAFRALEGQRGIARVVLLGPSHYVPFEGLALSPDRAFATPLGEVRVDPLAEHVLADCPAVVTAAAPHAREHSLEVELPFLQVLLGDFLLVPLAVGEASAEEVARVLDRYGEPDTRIVVSTDLSHYLPYEAAARRDEATAQAILALDPQRIGEQDACGRAPLRGLLRQARRSGWHARTLDLRSSGDTAGGRDRVVGYGAFAFA
jgi:AmmeMemoRadiSam system protein B